MSNKSVCIWTFLSFLGTVLYFVSGYSTIFFMGSASYLFMMMTIFYIIIVWFVLLMVIYKDAKSKGMNENWWIIAFFLSWLGGIIYYFKSRDKEKNI